MKTLFALALLVLSSFVAAPAAAQTQRYVSGTLQFEDLVPGSNPPSRPLRAIRFVTVRILVDGNQVATALTSSTGSFIVGINPASLPANHVLRIVYQARDDLSTVFVDNEGNPDTALEWDATRLIPSGTGIITLNDTVTDAELSEHFSIMDAIRVGHEYADDNDRREDDDEVGPVEVEYPEDDISRYRDAVDTIALSGPPFGGHGAVGRRDDAFEDRLVLHEYGHHLQYQISDIDGHTGENDVCIAVGYEAAWTEGWPTFFARVVNFTMPSRLSTGVETLETPTACNPDPPQTLGKVRFILWDLFDGVSLATEPHDRVDGMLFRAATGKTIANTLFGIFDVEQDNDFGFIDFDTDILSFHDAYVARNIYSGAHADLDRIYDAHHVYPHDLSEYSVTQVTAPATAINGVSVSLGITVRNASDLAYTDEQLLVTVSSSQNGGVETSLSSFTVAPFVGDQTFSRTVTIPSGYTQGTARFNVRVDPQNRFPETNEGDNLTLKTFTVLRCGNGICSTGESCVTCPSDCGACCGNGSCNGSETCTSCPADCGPCPICGDDFCNGAENVHTCPTDCAI